MLNKTIVKTTSALSINQILFNTELQLSVGIVIDDVGLVANAEGKKIMKAGMPMFGSLVDRNGATKFVKETTGATSNAVGILLHDVDLTDGDTNGTLLIFGFVNLNMIDATTAALITALVIAAIPAIKFLK